MTTKTQQLVDNLKAGNYKEALRIAKTFKLGFSATQRAELARGYECLIYPEFYKSLGKQPDLEVANAVALLKQEYKIA